jgi:hypothetical protein
MLEVSGFLGDVVDPDVLYATVVAAVERQLTDYSSKVMSSTRQ